MGIDNLVSIDKSNLNNSDKEWVLFIEDHRRYIIEKASKIIFTATQKFIYEYRPEDFLLAKEFPLSAMWIFLYINQYTSSQDFVNLDYVYLPDITQINDYYQVYKTVRPR